MQWGGAVPLHTHTYTLIRQQRGRVTIAAATFRHGHGCGGEHATRPRTGRGAPRGQFLYLTLRRTYLCGTNT